MFYGHANKAQVLLLLFVCGLPRKKNKVRRDWARGWMTFSSPEPPVSLSRRGLNTINCLQKSLSISFTDGVWTLKAFSLLGLAWRKDVRPMAKITSEIIFF